MDPSQMNQSAPSLIQIVFRRRANCHADPYTSRGTLRQSCPASGLNCIGQPPLSCQISGTRLSVRSLCPCAALPCHAVPCKTMQQVYSQNLIYDGSTTQLRLPQSYWTRLVRTSAAGVNCTRSIPAQELAGCQYPRAVCACD